MGDRILVLNGHPDPSPSRFAAALAAAYVLGAHQAGRQVRRLDVGALEFPLIRSQDAFLHDLPPSDIAEMQAAIRWADHLVIIFPLWLGAMPAVLKGCFEQVFRYGFAIDPPGQPFKRRLGGRSARVIVTMGMPRPIFRWVFGAAGLTSLERGLLWMAGVRPIRHLILGGVEGAPRRREAWLSDVHRLGQEGL